MNLKWNSMDLNLYFYYKLLVHQYDSLQRLAEVLQRQQKSVIHPDSELRKSKAKQELP